MMLKVLKKKLLLMIILTEIEIPLVQIIHWSYSYGRTKENNYEKRNKRSVWKINTQPYKEAHFAVFPEKLPELCIKAGSKKEILFLILFSVVVLQVLCLKIIS